VLWFGTEDCADEIKLGRFYDRERDFARMTIANPTSHHPSTEAKLPRRDWILLPSISLLTIAILAASTEMIARWVFSGSTTLMENCMVMDDPSTGPRAIPNTACWEKIPESQLVEYKFNSCGHRAGMECQPKQPGTYRIVMTGSSLALGEGVQRVQTFAALLPEELTQETGRKVELYNEGMGWGFSHSVRLRFNEVLAAKPDLILWAVAPADVEGASLVVYSDNTESRLQRPLTLPERAWLHMKSAFSSESFEAAASELFNRTRTALLLRHFLYQSQSEYVMAYQMVKDEESGFLKSDQSAQWKGHLKQFDTDAAEMEKRAEAAGVPFVAVLVPIRAQAAMISMGKWPANFDPYELDNQLHSIITRHGGIYLDILPDYRDIPDAARGYYPVDTHPNAEGHKTIADLLVKALTGGAVPALRVDTQPQSSLDKGR
jgi:hypothetical protein